MSQKLYTAAEARRIDIERGGSGRIVKPSDYDNNWHLFFNEETRTWRICENLNGQLQHGIYDSPFCLVKEIWLPLTASLEASTPEPEQPKPNYLKTQFEYAYDKLTEEKEQLEKENESLLAERNRLREWYEDYYTKQPTIEQLEEVLRNALDSREDLKKQLAEATNNYHEILADHGELTRKFDELKEKQLSKEDFQLIQLGRLILEVNKRAWELREEDS